MLRHAKCYWANQCPSPYIIQFNQIQPQAFGHCKPAICQWPRYYSHIQMKTHPISNEALQSTWLITTIKALNIWSQIKQEKPNTFSCIPYTFDIRDENVKTKRNHQWVVFLALKFKISISFVIVQRPLASLLRILINAVTILDTCLIYVFR